MLHYHVTKRVRLAGEGTRDHVLFPSRLPHRTKVPRNGGAQGLFWLVLSLRDLNWVMTIKGLMFLLFKKL